MSEKRRALGRGLGALIPTSSGTARPVDVFFRDRGERDPDAAPAVGRHRHPDHDHGWDHRESGPSDEQHGVSRSGDQRHPEAPGHPTVESDDAETGTTDGVGSSDQSRRESETELAPVPGAVFAELAIASIRPNPRQPRTVFDEDELAELTASIREIGVLQPIVVRRIVREATEANETSETTETTLDTETTQNAHIAQSVERFDDRGADDSTPCGPAQDDAPDEDVAEYELIMGERRLRASLASGASTIPAIIKDTQDDALLRDALLENLHRSQLNALEEAAAYQQLLDDFGCSHEELAARIGRSRPQISNTLRLLRLPPLVARRLAAGVLSAGHARALLGLEDGAAMERLAQRIVAEGLSVRSIEEIVSLGGDGSTDAARPRRPRAGNRHPQLDDLAARLSDRFDTRVSIALGQRKGRLTVEFASVDDLNRIVDLMQHRELV